jgi:oligosaccharide repeat unit polymerase
MILIFVLVGAWASGIIPDSYLYEGVIIWLMVLVTSLAVYFYHTHYRNPLDFFTPLYMMLIPYTIYFIIFPLDMIMRDKVLVPNQEQFLPTAMTYVFIGLIAFFAGFFLVLQRNLNCLRSAEEKYSINKQMFDLDFDTSRAASAAGFALLLAGCLWLFMVVQAGGMAFILSNLNQVYLLYFSKNMYFVSITNALFFVNLGLHCGLVLKRNSGLPLFCLNALLVLVMMLVQGSRGSIISVFFFLLVVIHLYRRRISLAKVLLLFAGLLTFMTSLLYFRDVLDPEQITFADLLYDALLSVNDEMSLLMGFISDMPHEYPFQLGASFLQLFLVPIPRAFWMAKPEVFQVVTTRIFMPFYSELDINWPPSIIGELYANFHLGGILVGMLLFGVLCGLLQVYVLRKRSFYRVLLYSIALFAVFREVRGDFATVTSLFLMQLLIFVAVGGIAFRGWLPDCLKLRPLVDAGTIKTESAANSALPRSH